MCIHVHLYNVYAMHFYTTHHHPPPAPRNHCGTTMCEVLPTIPESSPSPDGENSKLEQLMISMLEERDKLMEKLRESQERCVRDGEREGGREGGRERERESQEGCFRDGERERGGGREEGGRERREEGGREGGWREDGLKGEEKEEGEREGGGEGERRGREEGREAGRRNKRWVNEKGETWKERYYVSRIWERMRRKIWEGGRLRRREEEGPTELEKGVRERGWYKGCQQLFVSHCHRYNEATRKLSEVEADNGILMRQLQAIMPEVTHTLYTVYTCTCTVAA